MKQLWIIVQLADTACAKTVCERIGALVVEMGGDGQHTSRKHVFLVV